MMKQKQVKTILNKHKKRDSWFLDDYSVNPYEGCSCNCLYCYIRGSKYGENMEEGLAVKTNAVELLEKQLQLRAKKGQYGFIAVGTATDAYMPHEKEQRLTESLLQVILKYRFPVFISTKSTLILRNADLLKKIDETAILPTDLAVSLKRGVILSVSISSMDEKITNMLEPGAATPTERLNVLSQLKKEGFLTGVNAMPLLPFISDTEEELEKIIAAAKEHNADYLLAAGLTLFGGNPADSKILYYKFLQRYKPGLINQYNNLYRSNFYPSTYYQQQLQLRTNKLCKKYGIRTSILEII